MKLCGRWFSLLWVAVTLVCPQLRPALHASTSRTVPEWTATTLTATGSTDGFVLNAIQADKKAEEQANTERLLPQPEFFEPVACLPAPRLRTCGTLHASEVHGGVSPAIWLPANRGPPQRA